jgi:hypothetical protein
MQMVVYVGTWQPYPMQPIGRGIEQLPAWLAWGVPKVHLTTKVTPLPPVLLFSGWWAGYVLNFKKGEREGGQNWQVWQHVRGRLDRPNLNLISDLKASSSDLIYFVFITYN